MVFSYLQILCIIEKESTVGNIFQLTYNDVDSIIVGRYVGKEAPGGRWYL